MLSVIDLTFHRYLGGFQFVAIMTITAINICVQVFLWTYIFISQENTEDKITRPGASLVAQ